MSDRYVLQYGRTMIPAKEFDAAVFDLDGVVTDTASLHALAWKALFDSVLSNHRQRYHLPLQPFDEDRDYRMHLDGKPRLDGIRSFLQSRELEVPEGSPADPPGLQSVNAMGRLKNDLFLSLLQKQAPTVYGSTLEFINLLKDRGMRVGVVSSSRNCATILEKTGLSQLFHTRIDGVDAALLGIRGKPEPDIFLEAAKRLRTEPARTLVVEDAISGVRAARDGGFGLVIGICRAGNCDSLRDNGADVTVTDLSAISIDPEGNDETLPSALERFRDIEARIRGGIAIFLDYDGTLAPLAETPGLAVLPEEGKRAVADLARSCTVAIISGRDLRNLRELVNLEGIVYAGSHGFELSGPAGLDVDLEVGREFLPDLQDAADDLSRICAEIPGVLVERKRFAIAIHYRLTPQSEVPAVEAAVNRVAAKHPRLRKTFGKKLFELRPAMDWNKGKAVLSLLKTLNQDRPDLLPLYIGDDATDEDAFRALKGRGIGIVVREENFDTAATYALRNPQEVWQFLQRLQPFCRRKVGHGR